jgi:hypothetical protein
MRIFKKTAVVLASGLLMAGASIPAWSRVNAESEYGGLSFSPLTPEAAAQLPPWIKPSDVMSMSAETSIAHRSAAPSTDLAVADTSEQAKALLREVRSHIQLAEGSSFYSPQGEAEYKAGVLAFGEGKYAEAIEHLRMADKCVTDRE